MAGHAARYHRYHGAVATPSRFKGRPRQARACDERAFETCHIKVQPRLRIHVDQAAGLSPA